MTTHTRTRDEKVDDWVVAFERVKQALIVPEFEAVTHNLGLIPAPDPEDGIAGFNEYITAVNASLQINRIVRADVRTAALVAAMITQSGISRPQIDVTEE